jgi:hypothetical protein
MQTLSNSFLTPSQVLEKYPELKTKVKLSPNDIGALYTYKVLNGYVSSSKKTYICEQSVIDLIDFINVRLEKNKIKIN